jgi:hypothetical protein
VRPPGGRVNPVNADRVMLHTAVESAADLHPAAGAEQGQQLAGQEDLAFAGSEPLLEVAE